MFKLFKIKPFLAPIDQHPEVSRAEWKGKYPDRAIPAWDAAVTSLLLTPTGLCQDPEAEPC
jgi:hypothetical protein